MESEFKIIVTLAQFSNLKTLADRLPEYPKTVGNLRDQKGYCCLGVACDVSKLSEWSGNRYLGEIAILPNEVCNFYGFSCAVGFEIPEEIAESFFGEEVTWDSMYPYEASYNLAQINDSCTDSTHASMVKFLQHLLDNYTVVLPDEN